MQAEAEPRLLHAFLTFRRTKNLSKRTRAALRLCNKQIKAAIDATIIACSVKSADLDHFLSCTWPLKELIISNSLYSEPLSPEFLQSSLAALLGNSRFLKPLNALKFLMISPSLLALFLCFKSLH